jgi:molybdopterin synthase sulfur carrier subunit
MIQLRYFASLREQVDLDAETITPDVGGSVAEIRTQLHARGGQWAQAFADDRRVLAAVNQEMARPDTPVADGDELAFFPPVTGG